MRQSLPSETAHRINTHLTAKGMSGRQLAAASGLSVNTCARILRGDTDPKTRQLRRIAAALDVPAGDLLGDDTDTDATPTHAAAS